MKRSDASTIPAVAGILLVTIFSVLCLTIFAVTVLLVQSRNTALTERAAFSVSEFYAADARAQEILARLRNGEIPEGVAQEGNEYSFSCELSGERSLNVRARIFEDTFTVLEYKIVNEAGWETDDLLNVWSGE